MDLYPAIDLRGGHVVRLHQGDFAQETIYGDDPITVAKAFAAAGARWVHVVDLDAARRTGSNRDLVLAVAAAIAVPVQSGGGVRDASLLDGGVTRVVIGSAAVEDPPLVAELALEHPGHIAVGLDHRGGEIRTRGWAQGSGRTVDDLVDILSVPGVAAFVVTDITRDGALEGPDLDGYRTLVERTPIAVIASGGVGTLDDLRALADTGVAGAIVGKALYEGRFTVEEALAACDR
jgi:phosphoribosylformimino-5-aminoimidazole carboxamide ribotide isomerase